MWFSDPESDYFVRRRTRNWLMGHVIPTIYRPSWFQDTGSPIRLLDMPDFQPVGNLIAMPRVKTDDKAQTVTIDLPGVAPESINVSVDGNRLVAKVSQDGDERTMTATILGGYTRDETRITAVANYGRLVVTIPALDKSTGDGSKARSVKVVAG